LVTKAGCPSQAAVFEISQGAMPMMLAQMLIAITLYTAGLIGLVVLIIVLLVVRSRQT
jgi:hypothetical protein